jgi:hypothetical protein
VCGGDGTEYPGDDWCGTIGGGWTWCACDKKQEFVGIWESGTCAKHGSKMHLIGTEWFPTIDDYTSQYGNGCWDSTGSCYQCGTNHVDNPAKCCKSAWGRTEADYSPSICGYYFNQDYPDPDFYTTEWPEEYTGTYKIIYDCWPDDNLI